MESPIEQKPNNKQNLKPKQKFEGKVQKVSLQGALIDIGQDLPAFLHISQVVNKDAPDAVIKNLEEVFKEGDSLTVWIKRVLKDHLELTMNEPLALEWRELTPDLVVTGKIVRLENFGAFVEIGAERPGLVHVSELSHNYIRVPSELVKVGDEVEVKVLEVDRRKKQIKLSMKALQEAPEPVEKESRSSGKGGKGKREVVEEVVTEEVIPDPTFMEIAMRQAMDQAERRKPISAKRAKREAEMDKDDDDIYERTLKGRVDKE